MKKVVLFVVLLVLVSVSVFANPLITEEEQAEFQMSMSLIESVQAIMNDAPETLTIDHQQSVSNAITQVDRIMRIGISRSSTPDELEAIRQQMIAGGHLFLMSITALVQINNLKRMVEELGE